MKKITNRDLDKKADFLSGFLDFKIVVKHDSGTSIWYDYGCEGTDCVYVGSVSECNDYLNRLLRKHCLAEDWKTLKKYSAEYR